MAVGRITGPLLKANLLRQGENLAFESDLLYLDVVNGRIGIHTAAPTHDLTVFGTTRTTNLEVTTQAKLASFTLQGNVISSTNGTIVLQPGTLDPVVYQGKIVTGDLQLSTNVIETTATNQDLTINTLGTGKVNINSDVLVNGDIHATGNITADGDITIGNQNTDSIIFNADIASNIIPDAAVTYDLGSPSQEWKSVYTQNIVATNINAGSFIANGIDLALPQGNTYYVGTTGNDANSGVHENDQFLTIKHALSVATAGDTVFIYAGVYREQFPLTIPSGVTVRGTSIRSVTVKPTIPTRYNDAFLMNGETTVEDLTVSSFYSNGNYFAVVSASAGSVTVNVGTAPFAHTYVSGGTVVVNGTSYAVTGATYNYTTGVTTITHGGGTATGTIFLSNLTFSCNGSTRVFPDNGYAFRFANDITVVSRSPYIRNCTVITKGTPTVLSVNAFKTENNASITRIKNIITDLVVNNTITPSAGNTIPQIKNAAAASDYPTGVALEGLINNVLYVINNGVSDPALQTIVPNGALTTSSVRLNAAALIQSNIAFLKAEMVAYLNVTYPGFWSTHSQSKAERDLGYILDAIQYDILHTGSERSAETGINFWQNSNTDLLGFDRGDAGKGAFIDGAYANAASNEASLLFHAATFITPGVDTITAKNGTRVEWLNSFTYFANKGFNLLSSNYGFAQQGKTRLRIDTRVGNWPVGSTLTYYDTNGTTVLASGTIASVDGNYVNLTGKQIGFETITDRVGKTVYAVGDAKLSTSVKKFGTASLALDGTGDYATVATQPDFNFGTADFTIELWAYRTATGVVYSLIDLRPSAGASPYPQISISSTGTVRYTVGGVTQIQSGTLVLNTWTHVAVVRQSGVTWLYVAGVKSATSYTDTNNYLQGAVTIGATFGGSTPFAGYIDDLRISKVARYTTSFTPPTIALTGDLDSVLLLHFNGANNSTTFVDDGITYQDLRTSAGGTASLINFADYSDFGVEVRAIGSACVYGNYGFYGDGDGVIAYLMSQNFAYVGAGKKSTNDPNDRIHLNEVTKLNRAKIYYTSVDNEGNFSVGESFYVNQKTGDVLFNNQALSITAPGGVTFTDGVNTTTITAADITTGNIRIYGNNVDSLTGDINVVAASGSINLQNNTYVTGNLDITGNLTIGGNITIGDQTTDSINFVGKISSNLIPTTTATYNLGSSSPELRWKNVYLNRVEIDGLVIDNNVISTTLNNDDLQLTANGTGRIYVPNNNVAFDKNLTVGQNLTVTTGTTYLKNTGITGTITQTGNINQTGNFITSGNTEVTGNITGTGYLQLPVITISGNSIATTVAGTDLQLTANGTGNVVFEGYKVSDNNIQTTATDSNVVLTPQGTGSVVINSNQSLIIPVGTTSERPATGTNGMVRYNTTLGRYEGYNNGYWLALGGVQDADGNTYIKAEAVPGGNDNTIYFYADGTLMTTIDTTKLYTTRLQTSSLDIQNNTITTVASNTDINFTTSGTGSVKIGNFKIHNNTITNTVAGSITEFVESGTGYVKIAGTNGFVIPSGLTTDRPGNLEVGMTRFNTDLQIVEVWNGQLWTGVAGISSGITVAEASDIGVTTVLMLG